MTKTLDEIKSIIEKRRDYLWNNKMEGEQWITKDGITVTENYILSKIEQLITQSEGE